MVDRGQAVQIEGNSSVQMNIRLIYPQSFTEETQRFS